MTLLTIRESCDALLDVWRESGFELDLVNSAGSERSFEICLYKGRSDITLIAFFRIKVEKPGQGYFEFGLQIAWPKAEAIRSRIRPPRMRSLIKGTPATVTLSFVRCPDMFEMTTPVVLDGFSVEAARQLFASNRDSYLLRAIPASLTLCSPEGLSAALQNDNWRSVLYLPMWMIPIVFAAAGDEKSLAAWGQSNEVRQPEDIALFCYLNDLVKSQAARRLA